MGKNYLYLSFLFILATCSLPVFGHVCNTDPVLNDGPYIFRSGGRFTAKWIEKGILKRKSLTEENYKEFARKFGFHFSYGDMKEVYSLKPDFEPRFSGVDSIVIISDIHGRYDFYIDILKAHKVIDDSLNWSFGKGHLVVVGDVFDRGEKVTEVLWHLFGLEKQASRAGGKLHLLLGNHEMLLFSGNRMYNNPKYSEVEDMTFTDYRDLFSGSSVLGAWLRSKPVIMYMNDILFVHGGISIQTVRRNLDIGQINRKFHDQVLNTELSVAGDIEERKFLNNDLGPIWYRGYFTDAVFCELKMDSILGHFGAKHIVVGHTQCEEINSLFGDKVLGIDTSIQDEHPGEILLYKKGIFYRCLYDGKRIKI